MNRYPGAEPILESIEFDPPTPLVLELGDEQQVTATGDYSGARTLDLTTTVEWSSSDESVATVDASGLVTAVGVGIATITAHLGGVTASMTVAVDGAAEGWQVFSRRINQPADGNDFDVNLPVPYGDNSYAPSAQVVVGSTATDFLFPEGGRTSSQLQVQTTAVLEDGDYIQITVVR